jgi:hypothetical protein
LLAVHRQTGDEKGIRLHVFWFKICIAAYESYCKVQDLKGKEMVKNR